MTVMGFGSEAGLLRQVSVSGPKTFFDTNVSEHHHFYNEDDETVTDIPGSTIHVSGLPDAPEGMMIASVEVIVRLRSADGEPFESDANSIQLIYDGTRWWIVSVMWNTSRAE